MLPAETDGLARRRSLMALAIGLTLVAVNLRPALTSVGPLLDEVRSDLGLSSTVAGLLTALPVACFGFFAPAAPRLAERFGIEPVLVGALLVLAMGIALRAGPSIASLLAGTVIIGAAISIGNILLPVLIKHEAAERTGLLTGLYTMTMAFGASLAAGITVPAASALRSGWRGGLTLWALPALLAAIYWIPRMQRHRVRVGADTSRSNQLSRRRVLRSPIAWAVTLFFGLQSGVFYAAVGWLPVVLHHYGVSVSGAAALLSLALLLGIPTGLVVPILATRRRDQRRLVVLFVGLAGSGLLGLLAASGAAPLVWMLLLGFGIGGTFPLGLTLIVLRARDSRDTEQLSSLAQGVGYLLAAMGPLIVGELHDLTSAWTTPLLFMAAVILGPTLLAGLAAGRDRQISAGQETLNAAAAPRENTKTPSPRPDCQAK